MSRLLSNLLISVAISSSAIALSACGGGGSTATPVAVTPPSPPTSSAPTWTAGTFAAASSFKDQCQTPRSGVDIEGNAFPDRAGTTTIENFWLRSWTDETYLWNTEVADQNPATFTDRLAYFDQLRTTATTASGEDKDDFHFSENTEEFLERRNSAASSGYGVRFAAIATAPPRDFRILYTEPNSPASAVVGGNVNFPRGARILEVDGADLVNGSDTTTLNNGLFPATAGESHTFRIREAVTNIERDITIVSEDIAQSPVNRMKTIDTPTGKVGYLLFNTFGPFSSEVQLADAFTSLSAEGIDDLVLDLRYNGGGLLAVAAQLGYMIAGDSRTDGKRFELLQFNGGANQSVNPVTGLPNDPIPFYKTGLDFTVDPDRDLDTVNLPRVFILSTDGTCSASEAVINGLRGIDVEVILIGDVTCGKPYGFYPTDNCGETYYTIQFRGINEKDFGDYSDGFVPQNSSFSFGEKVSGCVVADDLDHELGDETEALLSAALTYRENGTCPAVTPKTTPIVSNKFSGADGLKISGMNDMEEFLTNNRDMRMPGGSQ